MTLRPEAAARNARRALLRKQSELLGAELAWLQAPDRIPEGAVGDGSDLHGAYFRLAAWILQEVVAAAHRVRDRLPWSETMERYAVDRQDAERVLRAVLEPTSRHAPGILAMAEIAAAAVVVAARDGVARPGWACATRSAERFAAALSCDGTDVQALIREYLRKPAEAPARPPEFDPALLRFDAGAGLATVTPLAELLDSARVAVAGAIQPPRGVCVALQAPAPTRASESEDGARANMFSAIWTAYAAAAERLILPQASLDPSTAPACASPDPLYRAALEALAQDRATAIREGRSAQAWCAASAEFRTL
jgi:hypothetical protein